MSARVGKMFRVAMREIEERNSSIKGEAPNPSARGCYSS